MADISLLQLAKTHGVKTVSDIARKLGRNWPPPPAIFVRDFISCEKPSGQWANYPATESLYSDTQSLTPFFMCTPQSLQDIVSIVREAEANQKHVHAFGSKWSFSDCAVTSDYLIDTTGLNKPIQAVQQALKDGQSPLVYHVEAGITIKDLYTNLDQLGTLDQLGQALITMGGASGQTLAGAISTGTHGGDVFRSPLADTVLALHLVGIGGTQFWIEPSSGVTDPVLLQKFVVLGIDPQNIIYDDATFDACVVSLGCMGVVYAVVLRVRHSYDLIETTTATTWQNFQQTANALLKDSTNRFLQVAIDPYSDSDNTNFCLVTTRTEAPVTSPGHRPAGDVKAVIQSMLDTFGLAEKALLLASGVIDPHGVAGAASLTQGQQLTKLIQGILDHHIDNPRPVLIEYYKQIMLTMLPPGRFRGSSYSVMDTTFGQPADGGRFSHSIELFFPATLVNGKLGFIDFVNAALAAINGATDTFYTGYVSLRFTGPTRAYLGMQQWIRTCAVEFSVFQGVQNELQLLTNILDIGLQHGGIPHWGQMIDLNVQVHGSLYRRYARWRQVYAKMSKNFTVRTFENALSNRWQLTSP